MFSQTAVHRCPAQQPPVHGTVEGCQNPFYGSHCNLSCDVGYDLIGEDSVSCDLSPNGSYGWSSNAPVCQSKNSKGWIVFQDPSIKKC